MKTLKLNEIKIGKRHREDLGDIDALAKSISDVGLLHLPVVLANGTLVAGERRLKAVSKLGWDKVPVNVVSNLTDAIGYLSAESQENTCRLDFTPEEAGKLGREIYELIAKPAADERKRKHGGTAPGRKKDTSGKFPEVSEGRGPEAWDAAAAAVGTSGKTLKKVIEVLDAADEDPEKFGRVKDQMNRSRKVNGAHKQVQTLKKAEEISKEPPPLPTGPFRVIVADPPWEYGNRSDDNTHRAANPYPSMTIEQIKAMPVTDMAHPDSILWLWTTNAHLPVAFEVVDAWGFEHKTVLTWVKDKMGTGDWLRGKTEHCIMAVRGKPTVTLSNQTTVISGPLREHSRKPEEFYELVESLCPGSKAELFSRTTRPGWASHGNEPERFNG